MNPPIRQEPSAKSEGNQPLGSVPKQLSGFGRVGFRRLSRAAGTLDEYPGFACLVLLPSISTVVPGADPRVLNPSRASRSFPTELLAVNDCASFRKVIGQAVGPQGRVQLKGHRSQQLTSTVRRGSLPNPTTIFTSLPDAHLERPTSPYELLIKAFAELRRVALPEPTQAAEKFPLFVSIVSERSI